MTNEKYARGLEIEGEDAHGEYRTFELQTHEWIDRELSLRGKTNVELAEMLRVLGWDVKDNFVSMLRTGKSKIPPARFGLLCDALGMTPTQKREACKQLIRTLVPVDLLPLFDQMARDSRSWQFSQFQRKARKLEATP